MKKVLLLGASGGLGKELSNTYTKKGYKVVSVSRTGDVVTDLSDEDSINKSINLILSEHEDISLIVCCNNVGYLQKLDRINFQDTKLQFEVNIVGLSYFLSKLFTLINNNGIDLLFVGATIGYKSNDFLPMYSASKWGVRGLVENWRSSLKKSKSRVILVSPGGMDTNSNIGEKGREKMISDLTGVPISNLLSTKVVAEFITSLLEYPRNMEISEVVINRK